MLQHKYVTQPLKNDDNRSLISMIHCESPQSLKIKELDDIDVSLEGKTTVADSCSSPRVKT